MMHAGGRHPLQIMAILHGHYVKSRQTRRCRGAFGGRCCGGDRPEGISGEEGAGELSTDSAPARVKRAIELLAQADLDLRGAKDLDPRLVMEVLVARLSKLRR